MTGHIPDSFIDELLSRVDIVEIISGHIPLKRHGANYLARCPFHTEKTPSFTVSQAKQFYHCFGCGVHGSALKFLMEFESLHFVEAVESLANRYGMRIPFEVDNALPKLRNQQIYNVLNEAAIFFQKQLRLPEGKRAIEYLKSRGLTGQTAKNFAIGYAPKGWEELQNAFTKKKSENADLVAAGLVVEKENKSGNEKNRTHYKESKLGNEKNKTQYYDRFRERIIFPIRDKRGRVIGFGGRSLNNSQQPKYLNSPETVVFNKGQEVYGLYEARQKDRHLNSLIVVEGYIDVLCLVQFGFANVVATLGTALTQKHLELLFKEVQELYFCFDGDNAGKKAAERALHYCLPFMKEGRRVKFVFLPSSEDPDSYVRRFGRVSFLDLLQHATSLSDYLFDQASATLDLKSIEGRALFVSKAKPLIEQLPEGILKQMMFERLAEISGMAKEFNQKNGNYFKGKYQGSNKGNQYQGNYESGIKNNLDNIPRIPPASPAVRAIAFLLENRNLLSLVSDPQSFLGVDIPGTFLLCAIIDVLNKSPTATQQEIEACLMPECARYFKSIDLKSMVAFIPKEGLEAEFCGALERLQVRKEEQILEALLRKAATKSLTAEEKAKLSYLIGNKGKDRVD